LRIDPELIKKSPNRQHRKQWRSAIYTGSVDRATSWQNCKVHAPNFFGWSQLRPYQNYRPVRIQGGAVLERVYSVEHDPGRPVASRSRGGRPSGRQPANQSPGSPRDVDIPFSMVLILWPPLGPLARLTTLILTSWGYVLWAHGAFSRRIPAGDQSW
jgi:hypothetical protein